MSGANETCRNWLKGDGFTCHLGGRAADCDGCDNVALFGVSKTQATTAHNLLLSLRDYLLEASLHASKLQQHINWLRRESVGDVDTLRLLDDIANRVAQPLVKHLDTLRIPGCIGQANVDAYECVNQLRDRLRTLVKCIPVTGKDVNIPLRG